MFEHFFRKGSAQVDNETLVDASPRGNTILFLYDEVDRDLWYDLGAHLNTLVLRLPDVFAWKYYVYPAQKRSEPQLEAFIADLQQAFLFIPCTSASFLTRFLLMRQKEARLTPLLAQTYVQPIPLRAAHGVTQSILAQPLAAYPSGHARDEACAQVVAALEQKLLSYRGMRANADVAPLALLAETTNRLMLPVGVRK